MMENSKNEMPKIISGKFQTLTIKARNSANNTEIADAVVRVFDRFGTKIFTTTTNARSSNNRNTLILHGEKLTIKSRKNRIRNIHQRI